MEGYQRNAGSSYNWINSQQMKYYLRNKFNAYLVKDRNGIEYWGKSWIKEPIPFDTIESAKSKVQELGGDFQIVNERFEVVWSNG